MHGWKSAGNFQLNNCSVRVVSYVTAEQARGLSRLTVIRTSIKSSVSWESSQGEAATTTAKIWWVLLSRSLGLLRKTSRPQRPGAVWSVDKNCLYYNCFVLQSNFYSDSQSCILLQHNSILQPAPPQLIFGFLSRRATIWHLKSGQTSVSWQNWTFCTRTDRRYNYVATTTTEMWQQQIMGIKKMKSSESENTEIGQVMGALIAM